MKSPRSQTATPEPPSSRGDEVALHVIWSGTVSFSLVAIPVQLVRAVEPGRVSFHMLHSKDYSPLTRSMFCPKEERIVPPDEIIRGYEIGPDRYLLITDEAVSYTHLRAHETRHDLVCRLLLEKK